MLKNNLVLQLLLLLIFLICGIDSLIETEDVYLRMPPIRPTKDQIYLCTSLEMPRDDHLYIMDIVNHLGNAPPDLIHHIQPYACTVPGYFEKDSPEAVWNCGDRDDPALLHKYDPCEDGAQLISPFKNIPGMPEEVGLMAGRGTDLKYIILQLHFGNISVLKSNKIEELQVKTISFGVTPISQPKFPKSALIIVDDTDYDVGIILKTVPSNSKINIKSATTYFLGTEGYLKAHSMVYLETACEVNDELTARALAFSTHTHSLGLQVAGYLRKANGTWYRIGMTPVGNTQYRSVIPDTFPSITKGDLLAARCVSYNGRDQDVPIGYDTLQEMCNFYLVYYTEEGPLMQDKYCYSVGPPEYSWQIDELMKDVPDWIQKDPDVVKSPENLVPHSYTG